MMPEYLAPGVYIEEVPVKTATISLEDLSLPAPVLTQLGAFCDHLKHAKRLRDDGRDNTPIKERKGISALFVGAPGTGKTLAAEYVASHVGIPLYRVDVSQVVSKYIGETEKNLAKVFEQAESSESILFFDEADALFGKRTEIKDPHDRYANLAVNDLLPRLETFDGIALLASNQKERFDIAFLSRLHTVITFPVPEPPRRLTIWARLWAWITHRLIKRH